MNHWPLTDLADIHHTGREKFMANYEKYLPPPDRPILLVELGVGDGNSLKMWGEHFNHKHSKVFGLGDLSNCRHDLPRNVRIYQRDPDNVLPADRVFNVVIDTTSGYYADTFHAWWPLVKPGGLYVMENTYHTYDPPYNNVAFVHYFPGIIFIGKASS